ncbi:CocE/NonD family hydrolase [Pseudomonas sp. MAFF 301449]|uniref:CocE/NonD family hydrolase n=1 Tax=Pseudomonas cyclaminis TaxID=2781239 RepID=A0ABR9SR62_9PSED|nr:CocE/NonD family hydrolase [Pseudomonas cyclaminis]MBE8591292.1 CocE/NonD family hydrolase [Pseudomonas cyclaminis]
MSSQNHSRFRDGTSLALGEYPGFNPQSRSITDDILFEQDVSIELRDGTVIYADIYRPAGMLNVPCIIGWAPYGKHPHLSFDSWPGAEVPTGSVSEYTPFEAPDPLVWCKAGYALLFPDVRGTWGSGGEASFFSKQEAEDEYDVIEWAARQQWCSSKVGLLGVSYLAVSQWGAAAEQPPHLAAIIPWEGFTDVYRELFFHGGIPNTQFSEGWQSLVSFSQSRVEDIATAMADHPKLDDYWKAKLPNLEAIKVPAYIVASWTDHALHTRGTLEAFKRIASEDKYLEVHGRKKWQYFYKDESVRKQIAFLDRYLKGVDNEVKDWPRVCIEVRDSFYQGEVRSENEWPLARTDYQKLYLDNTTLTLTANSVLQETTRSYVSTNADRLCFDIKFDEQIELTGHSKLRLWLAANTATDADVYVGLQKLDANGEVVNFPFFSTFDDGIAALGWLRASHRELDEARSTDHQPVHSHRGIQPLEPGVPVQLDIEIWPASTRFEAGESLRVVIQGTDIHRYRPGLFAAGHYLSNNSGKHTIYCGGQYQSYLIVPVIK